MQIFVALLVSFLLSSLLMAAEQVPFSDAVSDKIFNYHRHTPSIATSGSLNPGAIKELKTHGFKSVLDLRTSEEGAAEEGEAVRNIGLAYFNLPVGKSWPDTSTNQRFKQLVEDENNYPILIHCASVNRVGMMWAVYQLEKGSEYSSALLEGRTIGMKPSREQQLAEHLLPTAVPNSK